MRHIPKLNIHQPVKIAIARLVSVFGIIFKSIIQLLAFLILALYFSGCTNLIFLPDTIVYNTPSEFNLKFRDVFLKTPEKLQIHGWFLFSNSNAKGTVFFLHGNAQNITAHINSVYWLPQEGYNVFMIDYPGYGDSTGKPSIQGAVENIRSGFEWLIKNPSIADRPIFMMGQSLGAALGIYFVGDFPEVKRNLTGIILDAPFSNYRRIAREKLSGFWLTWPFQYPLSFLFTGKYNPEDYIKNLSPVPVLFFYSDKDKIVPSSHTKKMYGLANSPKFFTETGQRHVQTFKSTRYRNVLLEFMDGCKPQK